MKFQFDTLLQTRTNLLAKLEKLSIEEMNIVSKGFNNNIAWNYCHSILTMHILCYKLSNLPLTINEKLISKFGKGSILNSKITEEEINFFKSITLSDVEKLKKDYNSDMFKEFSKYPTSYNVTLTCIEDAITFNNLHEGLHFGYILAQIKSLNK